VNGESVRERAGADIAHALRRLERSELVELLTELIRIYVVEGTDVATPQSDVPARDSGHRTFAAVISDLKARFPFPELDHFRVDGDRVSVVAGDRVIRLEPSTVREPPPAPRSTQPPPSRPARPGEPPGDRSRPSRPAEPPGDRSRFLEVD